MNISHWYGNSIKKCESKDSCDHVESYISKLKKPPMQHHRTTLYNLNVKRQMTPVSSYSSQFNQLKVSKGRSREKEGKKQNEYYSNKLQVLNAQPEI
ncbi:hypothetical protein QQG55_25115 [Brugia pahangi]